RAAAAFALAIRELLLQRARALGLAGASDDESIDALLAQEVKTPEPTEEECRRVYDLRAAQFRSGDLVEAAHILFQVTEDVPLAAIRAKAEETLRIVRGEPARFAQLARELSNCLSGAQGGSLGQLGRGDTVPEFERALFGGEAVGVLPQLVRSRHGFHIVRIERRIDGRLLPFEAVREGIAGRLREQVRRKALQQYLRILAGQAQVSGIDFDAPASPLVQ